MTLSVVPHSAVLPALSFPPELLLKAQDGLEGARDTLELHSRSQKTASIGAARALVQPKEKRAAELEKVIEKRIRKNTPIRKTTNKTAKKKQEK